MDLARIGRDGRGEDGEPLARHEATATPRLLSSRAWPVSAVKIEVRDPLAKHVELLHKFTTADMHNLFAYLETLK